MRTPLAPWAARTADTFTKAHIGAFSTFWLRSEVKGAFEEKMMPAPFLRTERLPVVTTMKAFLSHLLIICTFLLLTSSPTSFLYSSTPFSHSTTQFPKFSFLSLLSFHLLLLFKGVFKRYLHSTKPLTFIHTVLPHDVEFKGASEINDLDSDFVVHILLCICYTLWNSV